MLSVTLGRISGWIECKAYVYDLYGCLTCKKDIFIVKITLLNIPRATHIKWSSDHAVSALFTVFMQEHIDLQLFFSEKNSFFSLNFVRDRKWMSTPTEKAIKLSQMLTFNLNAHISYILIAIIGVDVLYHLTHRICPSWNRSQTIDIKLDIAKTPAQLEWLMIAIKLEKMIYLKILGRTLLIIMNARAYNYSNALKMNIVQKCTYWKSNRTTKATRKNCLAIIADSTNHCALFADIILKWILNGKVSS